jgi:hypothetical protein
VVPDKYLKQIAPCGTEGPGGLPEDWAWVDTYSVMDAFGVQCPAVAHAIKKLLCAGQRGHKDRLTDLREAADAVSRAIDLEQDRAKREKLVPSQ